MIVFFSPVIDAFTFPNFSSFYYDGNCMGISMAINQAYYEMSDKRNSERYNLSNSMYDTLFDKCLDDFLSYKEYLIRKDSWKSMKTVNEKDYEFLMYIGELQKEYTEKINENGQAALAVANKERYCTEMLDNINEKLMNNDVLTAILVTGDASHAITIYGKEDMNFPGMYKYVCYDSNYRNENTYLYVMENNGFFQYYYKASLYDYQYATGNDNYGLLVYDKNLNML